MNPLTKMVADALSEDVRRRADLAVEEASSEEKAEIAIRVVLEQLTTPNALTEGVVALIDREELPAGQAVKALDRVLKVLRGLVIGAEGKELNAPKSTGDWAFEEFLNNLGIGVRS